jgi:hypothetical protein
MYDKINNLIKNKMTNQLIWAVSTFLLFSACDGKSARNTNENALHT